jgi:anti-sigma regulatory factor (Ser/Thr protein kinase)
VLTSSQALAVRISDAGRGMALSAVAVPDLAAKLAGGQSPRGWGLFLIQQMVDQVRKLDEPARHTVELLVNYDERGPDDGENA